MAWHFPDGGGVTVVMAIGDPPTEAQWAKRPKLRGSRCGARFRGILLRAGAVGLAPRIGEGFTCVEGGRDQKDFWLAAHGG